MLIAAELSPVNRKGMRIAEHEASPRFETELIHGSDGRDEIILRVLGAIFALLQDSPD